MSVFFFQAEDGIRDVAVTGVQTCALPIYCQGARINGRIAPLHRPLKNGDTVEVMTSPQAKPSRDWLAHVQTARARHKIRQWISREEHEKSLELGQEILAREGRRRRLAAPDAARLERGAADPSL